MGDTPFYDVARFPWIAAGVLLPAGGAGGLAIAGWLVRLMGHDTGCGVIAVVAALARR